MMRRGTVRGNGGQEREGPLAGAQAAGWSRPLPPLSPSLAALFTYS